MCPKSYIVDIRIDVFTRPSSLIRIPTGTPCRLRIKLTPNLNFWVAT